MSKVVYLIGSLRNERIPELAKKIRPLGLEVFDDWHSAGPDADDCFQAYRLARGMNYRDALDSYAARHIFGFDKLHLDRCDVAVLVLPAGKSGHLELGYCLGRGKKGYILFDEEPERFDQMYAFADKVLFNDEELLAELSLSSQLKQLPIFGGFATPYSRDSSKYFGESKVSGVWE